MYVSPAVRAIRDDPIPDESVSLVLRLDESADSQELTNAVRGLGGEPEAELPFGDLKATVAQETVEAACGLPGVEAVETADVHATDRDRGCEDVAQ